MKVPSIRWRALLGTLRMLRLRQSRRGNPACARSTLKRKWPPNCRWDHPRVRGEHPRSPATLQAGEAVLSTFQRFGHFELSTAAKDDRRASRQAAPRAWLGLSRWW